MTSRRMQHPCDPSPTRTRQWTCGEGAPAEHDEHIRNRPMALHHIAVIVSKEESLEFYKELGFIEISRQIRPSHHDVLIWMEGNGIRLEVFVDSTHPARVSNPEAYGLRHIAFEVDDLEAERNRLSKYNPEPIREDFRIFFVKDLDGCSIEMREKR